MTTPSSRTPRPAGLAATATGLALTLALAGCSTRTDAPRSGGQTLTDRERAELTRIAPPSGGIRLPVRVR